MLLVIAQAGLQRSFAVSDFLPPPLAALLSSLRCEQTPRKLRTDWDVLHHLPAFGR